MPHAIFGAQPGKVPPSERLNIAGVVFVASTAAEPGFIEKDNAIAIEQFGKVPVLGTVPYCPLLAAPDPTYDALPPDVVTAVENIAALLKIEKTEA